jgi:hypothetical protein
MFSGASNLAGDILGGGRRRQPGEIDTTKPENTVVALQCTTLLTTLQTVCAAAGALTAPLGVLVGKTPTINTVLPGLGVNYLCQEAAGGLPESIRLQMNVAYRAKPGASGSHPLCSEARTVLGVTAGPCSVANNPGQITTDPTQKYPEDSLVKAQCLADLAAAKAMILATLSTSMRGAIPTLDTTYSCTEITDPATEKESLKMGLTVVYTAKPGAGVQHIMCDKARAALGVTGKCGGT